MVLGLASGVPDGIDRLPAAGRTEKVVDCQRRTRTEEILRAGGVSDRIDRLPAAGRTEEIVDCQRRAGQKGSLIASGGRTEGILCADGVPDRRDL